MYSPGNPPFSAHTITSTHFSCMLTCDPTVHWWVYFNEKFCGPMLGTTCGGMLHFVYRFSNFWTNIWAKFHSAAYRRILRLLLQFCA